MKTLQTLLAIGVLALHSPAQAETTKKSLFSHCEKLSHFSHMATCVRHKLQTIKLPSVTIETQNTGGNNTQASQQILSDVMRLVAVHSETRKIQEILIERRQVIEAVYGKKHTNTPYYVIKPGNNIDIDVIDKANRPPEFVFASTKFAILATQQRDFSEKVIISSPYSIPSRIPSHKQRKTRK